ncbi:MAG: flagellar basal body rod modification protein [Rhodobacterales bacterium]|nr:flagellar basal body rod modification protein [Rhodobacterales bacterium]
MDIAPTTASATTPSAAAGTSTRKIASDFDTFLRMLTVQMQNQDPLNPVDSSDYAVQLATFSGVEQQVQTNDLLKAMAAQMGTSGMAQMAAWVGREARAPVAAHFTGAPITVAPNPALLADTVEMVVRNSSGTEVQRMTIPTGAAPVEWSGVGEGGLPFPSGLYSFEIISSANGEVLLAEQADVYSTVTEVRSEGGQTILMLSGGVAVPASLVTALRDPTLR